MCVLKALFLTAYACFALAQANESAPNAFEYTLHTTESIVDINGKKYRKVEYKNEVFYLRLIEDAKSESELELDCRRDGKIESANKILVAAKVTVRNSLFVDGLRQTCTQMSGGNAKIELDPNIRVGFILDGTKTDLLKNKKVYYNPLTNGVGLSGEW